MKVNPIKTVFAIAISALLGLLCFAIAKETDYRNWISFAVTTITLGVCLFMSFGIDYNCGIRKVNIKVISNIFVVLSLIVNFAFSFFEYNVIIYVVISVLVALLGSLLTYSIYPRNKQQEQE